METHLDKAKGALEHAKEYDNRSAEQDDLFIVARLQAEVAQAEALTRIADVLERLAEPQEQPLSAMSGLPAHLLERAEAFRKRERELQRVDL